MNGVNGEADRGTAGSGLVNVKMPLLLAMLDNWTVPVLLVAGVRAHLALS